MISLQKGFSKIREAVRSFNQERYSSRDSINEYFEFRFDRNPLSKDKNTSVFAISDGKIIAQILLLDSQIKVKAKLKNVSGGWIIILNKQYKFHNDIPLNKLQIFTPNTETNYTK